MDPGDFIRKEFPFNFYYMKSGSQQYQNRYAIICSRCKISRNFSKGEMIAHLMGTATSGKKVSVKKCNMLLSSSFDHDCNDHGDNDMQVDLSSNFNEFLTHIFLAYGYSFHSIDNVAWQQMLSFLRRKGIHINNINRKIMQTQTLSMSQELCTQHERLAREKMKRGFSLLCDSWKGSKHTTTTVVLVELNKITFPIYNSNDPTISRDHIFYNKVLERSIESLRSKNMQIEDCLAVVTDGAGSIKKAGRMFAAAHSLVFIRCGVHALNLLIGKICNSIPEIKQIQRWIRDIAQAVRRYEVITKALQESDAPIIPATSTTRFGYIFFQFECVKKNFAKYKAAFNCENVSSWIEHSTNDIRNHIQLL